MNSPPWTWASSVQRGPARQYSRCTRLGDPVPDPVLVLELEPGRLVQPAANDRIALERTPEWAKAMVEAALAADESAI